MVEQDHAAAECFLALEPMRPRKPKSIKATRFLHFVTGLAIPVSPGKDSTKHGGGVAAALWGFWLWLPELSDGSPGCSCPWGGSKAVVCQHSALWRAKPLLGAECWSKRVATAMSCCAAVPSAPGQEVLSIAPASWASTAVTATPCCRDKVRMCSLRRNDTWVFPLPTFLNKLSLYVLFKY